MKPITWTVEGSKGNLYIVTLGDAHWSCTCPARKEECRHVVAIRQLQRLALLDKAAVDTLEQLAKTEEERQEEEDPFQRTGYQPESMTPQQNLDEVSMSFTNDPAALQRVAAFRDAAAADGWSIAPTYKSESQDRAASLEREGFKMQVLCRADDGGKWQYETSVNIWGPDGLAIRIPEAYNWEQLKAGLRTCSACGATDVQTHRFSFAGRCCEDCLPTMKAEHEKPGWDN